DSRKSSQPSCAESSVTPLLFATNQAWLAAVCLLCNSSASSVFHRCGQCRKEVQAMRYLKYVGLFGVLLFAVAGSAQAQVAVGVRVGPVVAGVGPAPVCPYGYYGYYPYACAPYGYYGPSYFVGGVFIGAGPWYHGYYGHGFYGRGYYGGGYYGHGGYGYRGGYAGGGFHGNAAGYHGGDGYRAAGGHHGGGSSHGGGHR